VSAPNAPAQTVTQPPIKRHRQRPGKNVVYDYCFSVPRWQCLTLPDPSQRWDLYPEPYRLGIFFALLSQREIKNHVKCTCPERLFSPPAQPV
jgi:hypothetical protein